MREFFIGAKMFNKETASQYELFEPYVKDIENKATFVSAGSESVVYALELFSEMYAIKIAQKNLKSIRGRLMDKRLYTENRMKAARKGMGIFGLEQFITGCTEDYALVFQYVKGINLNTANDNFVEYVSEDQKQRFNQTVADATKAGLEFDSTNTTGSNAFYDPAIGFTLIDYSEQYRPVSYRENWSAALRSLGPIALEAFALSNRVEYIT
jgi:hypothetical protein